MLAKERRPDEGHVGEHGDAVLRPLAELGLREVPDPYYGGPDGFDRVLDLVEASTTGLLARLQATLVRR